MNPRTQILLAVLVCVPLAAGFAAEGNLPTHDLRVVSQQLPPRLETAAIVELALVVANEGDAEWSHEEGYALAYHWFDRAGNMVVKDGRRTELRQAVPAGSEAAISATLQAPSTAGEYLLQWDVVREGVLWVSNVDPTPAVRVPVTVFAGHVYTLLGGKPPRFLTSGANSVARLKVRNDGSRTWKADGSFAFSYHWLDGDRAIVQQDGRRTTMGGPVGPGETIELAVVIDSPPRAGFYRLQWDMVEEGVTWFSQRMPAPSPQILVVVVPDIFSTPAVWAVLTLLAAAAALASGVQFRPQRWIAFIAAADLSWCFGSIVFKQAVVLSEVGLRPTFSGWMLMAGTASIVVLAILTVGEKWRPWACWTGVAIATFLLWGDALYLRFFHDLPGPGQLAAVGQIGSVTASGFSLMKLSDIWIWLDLLPGLVLVMASKNLRCRGGQSYRRGTVLTFSIVLVAAGALGTVIVLQKPDILRQVFRRVLVAREVGVFNQHAADFGRWLLGRVSSGEIDPARYRDVLGWFSQRSASRSGVGPHFGAAAGCNVVMIQVESLQGFVLGLEVGGREVTPFLNRWAENNLWFSNITDQTEHGRSSDAELATQASLLPASDGAAAFRFGHNDFVGLAEVLVRSGYLTLSAVPYDGSFWNRRVTHEAYGFSRSFFVEDFSAGESVGWGLSDRDFLVQAADRLATADVPFAAYLLTLSLHHPFEGFPRHLEALDVGPWDGTPYGNFLHTMHFFDASLAAFVESLESSGLADTTVVAIWGDHDAGFDWRREIAMEMDATFDSAGWYLSQEVPFLIRLPGMSEELRGERRAVGGHVDVAPTLLALLGVDPAPFAFVGRNLLGATEDVPVPGEYGCWRTSELLFLAGDDGQGDGTCLDLATLAHVPMSRCEEDMKTARRMEEISALVLEYDLQRRIHVDLNAGVGEPK